MNKTLIFYLVMILFGCRIYANETTRFSTAGFYEIPECGRKVFNFNTGWRFSKDPDNKLKDAFLENFDDSDWEKVALPHGLDLLPEESSGDKNYQGKAWYRKKFKAEPNFKGKKVFIHFEGIMGKSKIWINGKLIQEHFGGYLPAIADISEYIHYDRLNQISVLADNSNDPLFPPGKAQQAMDFAYFGGIYRDCMLIVHNKVYITDPNYENQTAGGGTVIWTSDLKGNKVTVNTKIHLRNENSSSTAGHINITLSDSSGQIVAKAKRPYKIHSKSEVYVSGNLKVDDPILWSPENPVLYTITYQVTDKKGAIIDGYKKEIGIRTVEFKGENGFWLNGKHYPEKLMGVNRHQDFAVIGNAMTNSLHYRDAVKLKEAGIRIIRSAHYPQDPAFLDACDRLGIFVITATPGWQFWNDAPIFEERVISDIRNMVRRDRSRPCVFFWEPILNETHFPESFSLKALKTVEEEWPYTPAYSACDPGSSGSKYYPVIYTAPNASNSSYHISPDRMDKNKVYFTREWGDNVDDWSANNSTSRVHRSWGEQPMLIQATHYANPPYEMTCYETFFNASKQHLGGTLWCGFDHSRACHPVNFYGGIMDSYRQPKYSYYMMMAQRPATVNTAVKAESGPMVYIAHDLSPFSSTDVTVYSNCEEVRLTVYENGKRYTYLRSSSDLKMPSPVIIFKDVYKFMELKKLARGNKRKEIYLLAEGLIDGKVVVSHKVRSALKPTKLKLRLDTSMPLRADGSDIAVVIAELIDDEGNVKHLNNDFVRFSIKGEGRLLENEPSKLHKLNWGSAPILVQSTSKPGEITIKAELETQGSCVAQPAEITITSICTDEKFIAEESEIRSASDNRHASSNNIAIKKRFSKEVQQELEKVYRQQEEFGEKTKY